ncbi:hypothetical protein CHS0354_032501 [Potamilus streckersoni]|uniref:Exportin-5 n=1 Tax=Potamilus streckersoni TaxID=2493646 RepID=A0AAE0SPV5_9BIVA|nr:hypothetical protein CHS0354_032501 [Potamilus streckersoni]
MDPKLKEIIPALTQAVETIMNPSVSSEERLRAHEICESFKENTLLCIKCGFILASKEYLPIIRHFGLQLLEHSVRFSWNSLRKEEKETLKKNSLEMIAFGTSSVLDEAVHIKDAVSRVMVEIIKHEWPQLWPSLLSDFYNLSLQGEVQTELVLKVYLRLVEDVVIFQSLPTQRRREIMQALTANMADIFGLFITLLQEHIDKAQIFVNTGENSDKIFSQVHTRVSEAILTTMSGYLDWVNMSHILMKDNVLLQMLCLLLGNPSLQLQAAECLLIIVSRKGKLEDRKPILILFSEDAMCLIWNAAVAAEKESKDEYYYLFLKRLCQVLTEIGKQLSALWGSTPDVKCPPNLAKYLEALLAFTRHPSQMLSSLTQQLWATFLRHEHISTEEAFLSFIPRIMESASKTLFKVGYPSQSNSVSCDYARLDFDSDEEFNTFYAKYRAEVAEIIRLSTLLRPKISFSIAYSWLMNIIRKPVDVGAGSENGNCNLSSPSFVDWDAMTVFLESVMSKLMLSDQPKPDPKEGIQLLKVVLEYETQDPLILSCLLSCISALFVYLQYTPETLLKIIQKVFFAVIFNLPGQTKATRSKAVKNVRQHACSALVKICRQYSELLFPIFDELYKTIQTISSDPEQLSQMEKCILVEALILISNQYNNFEKQSKFLEEVLTPVKELWLSTEFKEAFWLPVKFMTYVGLDQAPVEPSSADTCGINRSHITYCINMILAVLKRSKVPEEPEKAEMCGFVICKKENGNIVKRNPATVNIVQLMENVMALIKTMNSLWLPENLSLRHPAFSKSYDLLETEKLIALGIPPPCVDNTGSHGCKGPLERMQNFLTLTHDSCCHILGNACQCLEYELYCMPNLANSLLSSTLTNLDTLPDYRLRPLILYVFS